MSLSKDSSVESAIKTILKNRCMSARLALVHCKFVYDYDAIANAISREKIASPDKNLWRYRKLLPSDGEHQVRMYSVITARI